MSPLGPFLLRPSSTFESVIGGIAAALAHSSGGVLFLLEIRSTDPLMTALSLALAAFGLPMGRPQAAASGGHWPAGQPRLRQ
jgi:hypothetical protein